MRMHDEGNYQSFWLHCEKSLGKSTFGNFALCSVGEHYCREVVVVEKEEEEEGKEEKREEGGGQEGPHE